jgi:hypothetical protein
MSLTERVKSSLAAATERQRDLESLAELLEKNPDLQKALDLIGRLGHI